MDKSSFLLCTNNNGQPILDENGKYIYYCTKTGALTILDQSLGEASMNENTRETAVNENISQTAMSENINENTVNNKTDKRDTQKMEIANEDKFTHEMTTKLLEIVQTKFHYLNDKMHCKKKIWNDIAIEMQNSGYLMNYNGTKGADKCHQRWRNLEKMYRGHYRYMKSTGTGKKKPPKYFDEMHDLIGEKHSNQPVNLLDSLDVNTTSATCNSVTTNNEIDNDEKFLDKENIVSENDNALNKDHNLKISNIFENVKKSVRPKKDNLSVVLKELHTQDIQIENERFERFQTLLTEQNELKKKTLEQSEEFLKIMKNFVSSGAHKKAKKRKYSSDSD